MFKQLYENEEWFRLELKRLEDETPSLPKFDPSRDNTDQWKYDSGLREGYLLLLAKLKP